MTTKPARRVLDPAVADIFTRVAVAKPPATSPDEKARQAARLPGRVNLDLPPYLKERLLALAEREGVPASQLAALAIIRLLDDLSRGLQLPKAVSASPRYRFTLDLWENHANNK